MGTQCRTHLEGYYMVPGILPMLYIGNSPVHLLYITLCRGTSGIPWTAGMQLTTEIGDISASMQLPCSRQVRH